MKKANEFDNLNEMGKKISKNPNYQTGIVRNLKYEVLSLLKKLIPFLKTSENDNSRP